MNGSPLARPASDDVLTMCAGCPWASSLGRNAWTPWTTPHRFTPSTHRQSSSVWATMGLNVETPGVVADHVHGTEPVESGVGQPHRSAAEH